MTTRTIEMECPTAEAWSRLKVAAASVGKVKGADETSNSLVLTARYGLNPVRVRIVVNDVPRSTTSVLEIQARGQDVWGVASRRVIDRLCVALR